MPSSSFVFGNFYVAFSPRICCRSLPRFRSFVRVSSYFASSVSSPLFEFVVISIVPVAGVRFRLRRFFVCALSCVFLRFVVRWFAFVLIVRCNRCPCFEGRFSFVRLFPFRGCVCVWNVPVSLYCSVVFLFRSFGLRCSSVTPHSSRLFFVFRYRFSYCRLVGTSLSRTVRTDVS